MASNIMGNVSESPDDLRVSNFNIKSLKNIDLRIKIQCRRAAHERGVKSMLS
jgi:hypothetical protein